MFMILSFFAGVAIATTATLNAYLGQLLASSLLATCIAFVSGSFFTITGYIYYTKEYPTLQIIKTVPIYLWFTGGVLSAFALASFYYLIPKIGILPMLSFSLGGQLLFSVVSGHFGLFGLPQTSVTIEKLVGVAFMLLAIYLINKG